jgi:hypothetical protein
MGSSGRQLRRACAKHPAERVYQVHWPDHKATTSVLRWVLVQNARHAIKYSEELRFFFLSVSRRCGRHGAIIATARKLLEIAYRVLRDQKPFDANLVGKKTA